MKYLAALFLYIIFAVAKAATVAVNPGLHENQSFIPDGFESTVTMNITFISEEITFTVCCQTVDYPKRTFSITPFGMPVATAEVRTGSHVDVILSNTTAGAVYTVMMVDPDVPHATVGTPDLPLLHWQVANIRSSDLSGGDTIKPYLGPGPPNGTHRYYFLLYEQTNGLITSSSFASYAGHNCVSRLSGRCLYDVKRMTSQEKMKLVSVSMFRATYDDYRRWRSVQGTNKETAVCNAVKNYPSRCSLPVVG